MKTVDLVLIGGGIVGLATAYALRGALGERLVVLEAEPDLAAHQTGHNSGVIHSGLYYRPGSRKARLSVAGREALYRFCAEHDVACERCGKLVIATSRAEVDQLDELERRGHANGLVGVRRLRSEQIREEEPHAVGLAALLVPETGIVHYSEVARAMAKAVRSAGGIIETGARVIAVNRDGSDLVVESERGAWRTRALIACAGLQADRVARLCGLAPEVSIVPFRGEYYELRPERRTLVRNLIYPVPDPRFPFLGVHFTRRIHGGIEAGPNAVLAFKREGYRRSDLSVRDLVEMARFVGSWRMATRYWRKGLDEYWRSFSTRAFVTALQRLVPELTPADIERSGAGVRAQAVDHDGNLVDDFQVIEANRMIHVLNAPSPAATASLSIGAAVAEMARRGFGWQ